MERVDGEGVVGDGGEVVDKKGRMGKGKRMGEGRRWERKDGRGSQWIASCFGICPSL